MNLSLQGKRAVVCGSTQGIGLAVAKELALLGATCLLLARNEAALQELAKSLPAPDGQIHGYRVADFKNNAAVWDAITSVTAEAPVHILINNTGGPPAGPITEAEATDFVSAFQQHLVNNQLLTKAVLPQMKAAGFGRIINIISTSVKVPLPDLGVSNTIRAAVASWAKTLSNEVAAYGITVNNVLPGFTDTARLQSLIQATATKTGHTHEQVTQHMKESVPAKRFGEAHEVAAVAAFLATPAAAYVNGTSIPVDGGRTGTLL